MSIGEFAKTANVGVETIRFYERRGLLQASERLSSGYRRFTLADLEQLRFIRGAQLLGFTLREIQQLLQLRSEPTAQREEVRTLASESLNRIDEKIRELQAMRHSLQSLLHECSGAGPVQGCPIVQSIQSTPFLQE
jgi:MerR family transcriptional regulator, copper efflux regulator